MVHITHSSKADGTIIVRDIHSLCVVEMNKNRDRASLQVTVNAPPNAMPLETAKEFAEVVNAVLAQAEQDVVLNEKAKEQSK